MKSLTLSRLVCSLFAAASCNFFLSYEAEARVGETRNAIEGRLFASGGIVYRDDVIESNRRGSMSYMRYLDYLGGNADVRIYFKTADGRRPKSSELEEKKVNAGWDLHVVYVNGKSVIEVYKRSSSMTEHEMNQLLAVNSGSSYWKRVSKEDKEETVSAFDFDMVRDDGSLRAKKLGGDSILFVDPDLDIKLAQTRESELQEKAPLSVSGF